MCIRDRPTTDVGSQVIVNGQVRGNMRAKEYIRRKRDYIPAVLEAYNSLTSEYDVIVIEGAGSPAEINLKQDDIVNMGLAKLVDCLLYTSRICSSRGSGISRPVGLLGLQRNTASGFFSSKKDRNLSSKSKFCA